MDYFSGERSWFEFYEFLNGLPSFSRFKAAVALDPEYAEVIKARMDREKEEAENEESSEGWKPETRSQEGFTPSLSAIYTLIEAVNEVPRTLIAVNGKKPPKQVKMPRPVSALDVLELEDERDEMAEMAARFRIGQPD